MNTEEYAGFYDAVGKWSKRTVVLVLFVVWYHYWLVPMADILANHPHPVLEALRQYVLAHIVAIVGSLGWFCMGAVKVRPPQFPQTWHEAYLWFGDSLDASLPGPGARRQ